MGGPPQAAASRGASGGTHAPIANTGATATRRTTLRAHPRPGPAARRHPGGGLRHAAGFNACTCQGLPWPPQARRPWRAACGPSRGASTGSAHATATAAGGVERYGGVECRPRLTARS